MIIRMYNGIYFVINDNKGGRRPPLHRINIYPKKLFVNRLLLIPRDKNVA